jgi:RNA polymerase sigma factor (TIGR02999 family)
MSKVTQIAAALALGGSQTSEELLPLVYEELRRLAACYMARERPGQTLQATALVHEAYLRLAQSSDLHWEGRRHFFAAAAEAMRRILTENARRKHRPKHGGDLLRVDLQDLQLAEISAPDELLALDDAVGRLSAMDPEAAELVKLRFFAGLTEAQAAELMGISRRTATRTWAYARAWLFRELRGQ